MIMIMIMIMIITTRDKAPARAIRRIVRRECN